MASVVGLWRYPVKSLAGEACTSVEVDGRGVAGDRGWALVASDRKIASGKSTRRFRRVPGLLVHRARLDGGVPLVDLVDGRTAGLDDEIAEELAGPGWSFAPETDIPHFDAGAVHVVTTATLAGLAGAAGHRVEVERLRPNVLVDAGDTREEEWIGRRLRVGEVELEVTGPTERCVMVGLEHAELPRRPRLLKSIGEWNALNAGVYARVVRPGRIGVGDAVTLGRSAP